MYELCHGSMTYFWQYFNTYCMSFDVSSEENIERKAAWRIAIDEVLLLQNFFGMNKNSTGGALWDSSLVLWRKIQDLDLRGQRVLELGSGVGFLAIKAASKGAYMIATDGDLDVIELLRENIARNHKSIQVTQLKWGDAASLQAFTSYHGKSGDFDYVLGADLIYNADFHVPLLQTLLRVCSASTRVIMTYRMRDKDSAQFDAHLQPKAYPNLTDEESIRLVCAPLPSPYAKTCFDIASEIASLLAPSSVYVNTQASMHVTLFHASHPEDRKPFSPAIRAYGTQCDYDLNRRILEIEQLHALATGTSPFLLRFYKIIIASSGSILMLFDDPLNLIEQLRFRASKSFGPAFPKIQTSTIVHVTLARILSSSISLASLEQAQERCRSLTKKIKETWRRGKNRTHRTLCFDLRLSQLWYVQETHFSGNIHYCHGHHIIVPMTPWERAMIVGLSGVGKSTLATQLSQDPHIVVCDDDRNQGTEKAERRLDVSATASSLRMIDLDDARRWAPVGAVATDDDNEDRESTAITDEVHPRWVIAGYDSQAHRHVHAVIWLDYSLWRTAWQLLRRTVKRCWTQELLSGNHREFWWRQCQIWCADMSTLGSLLWHYKSKRRAYLMLFAQHAHIPVLRFQSPVETKAWLDYNHEGFAPSEKRGTHL